MRICPGGGVVVPVARGIQRRQLSDSSSQESHVSGFPLESLRSFPQGRGGGFGAALYSYNGLELVPGIARKRRVLSEVHRVLRPGGRFVFCTHSLLALNRHAPMRLWAFARFLLGQLGLPVRERELGERFIDDELEEARYLQILLPGTLRRMLRAAGFRVLHFNTRTRIEKRRPPSPRSVLADGERFFVAERTGEVPESADT